MSKKRKTRKEKVISQLRRELHSSHVVTPFSFTPASEKESIEKPLPIYSKPISTKNYSYVYHDIKQTLVIVGILMILNVGVFFLIQTRIIHMNF